MSEVGDGCGHDVPSPGVLNIHRDPRADSQVSDGPRFRQAAHFTDLKVDNVGALIRYYPR